MADRYYNKVNGTEAIPGFHSIDPPDVVILAPANPFWSPLPAGQQLTYTDDIPDGLEPIPAPDPLTLPAAVIAAKVLTVQAELSAYTTIESTDGVFTFSLTLLKIAYVLASGSLCDLEDVTGVIRTLTVPNVDMLKDDYVANLAQIQSDKVAQFVAIDAAIDLAAVNVILNDAPFAGLGPV